jgi:DNA-binding transcriptional LysR family regulator
MVATSFKRFVERGLGISIVMSICITGRDRLEAIPVSRYFPKRTYGVVRLKGASLSPQAREFIRILGAAQHSAAQ